MNLFSSKQTFKLVVAAIQAGKSEVPYNKTWQRLHSELGIGSVSNRILFLTAKDRQDLELLIKTETHVDIAQLDLCGLTELSRSGVSRLVVDEKWAKRKVREDIVYLKSGGNKLKLNENYHVPEGGYLAIPWQQAIKHRHQIIIAIENLEVFLNAEYINWPSALLSRDPIIIYRGDTEATPAAFKKFVESTKQDYYVFFDYDPAGFMMALTQPRQPTLIIPDAPVEKLKECSKKIAYDEQLSAVRYLEKNSARHQAQIDIITAHHLAVMQEKILSFQIPLKIIQCVINDPLRAV